MNTPSDTTRLRIRLYFPNGTMFGPGKADLLALIGQTGSIAAAGRKLGMSYKRAWGLVDTMNNMFGEPLVTSSRGGAAHGGATVTETGERVLALYRKLQENSRSASATEIATLQGLLTRSESQPLDIAKQK
ncbi:MAG: winged helix-turn-helix domain-containing protein [Hyphomicrobiaceae bacterium]|nr:winged helix-turn-helix domain-containing protein [Hyphomicrobiaceae bacterium]